MSGQIRASKSITKLEVAGLHHPSAIVVHPQDCEGVELAIATTSETFASSRSHTQRSIRDRRPSGRLAQGRGAVADLSYSALALRAAAANASMVGYSRS